MSAREFVEWQEYYAMEPFGDDWMQTATIASSNVNLWAKHKVRLERFIPRARRRKTPEEMEREMMAFAKMHNKRQGG